MNKTLQNKICVCVNFPEAKECNEALAQYPFAELRADLCRLTTKETESLIEAHPECIFTFRFNEETRKMALEQTLAAIDKGVRYVDVDILSPESFIEAVRNKIAEKGNRTSLVVSSHQDSVPSLEEMKKIVLKCKKAGADIVKTAPFAKTLEEASRVLELYSVFNEERGKLIAFARGEAGQYTRIACTSLGSPWTYCSASNPVDAGQYSYRQMLGKMGYEGEENHFRTGEGAQSELFSRFCTKEADTRKNLREKFVSIPCSKSIVQRALIAAALCNGQTVLRNFEPCADTDAAIAFIRKCGCVVTVVRDGSSKRGEKMAIIKSAGIEKWKSYKFVNVGESALLARLILPVSGLASSLRNKTLITTQANVTGEGSLLSRDFSQTIDALKKAGIKCLATKKGGKTTLPVNIYGASFKNSFTISGKETSQLVSGLLMVLPMLPHKTRMVVEDAVSIPFIELTIKVLEAFGIRMKQTREDRNIRFDIEGNQTYTPVDMFLESDWSSASNFAVAGTLASMIADSFGHPEIFILKKMTIETSQADERILEVLQKCGVQIQMESPEMKQFAIVRDNRYNTRRSYFHSLRNIVISSGKLDAFCFDATDCPDLFPILTTLAVYCQGESRIKGVHRLEKKESNRALSILSEFSRMGYDLNLEGDELVVRGNCGKAFDSGNEPGSKLFCSSHNDHRIAMAVIVCSLFRNYVGNAPRQIYLDNISCIDKSFPTFVERLKMNKTY